MKENDTFGKEHFKVEMIIVALKDWKKLMLIHI